MGRHRAITHPCKIQAPHQLPQPTQNAIKHCKNLSGGLVFTSTCKEYYNTLSTTSRKQTLRTCATKASSEDAGACKTSTKATTSTWSCSQVAQRIVVSCTQHQDHITQITETPRKTPRYVDNATLSGAQLLPMPTLVTSSLIELSFGKSSKTVHHLAAHLNCHNEAQRRETCTASRRGATVEDACLSQPAIRKTLVPKCQCVRTSLFHCNTSLPCTITLIRLCCGQSAKRFITFIRKERRVNVRELLLCERLCTERSHRPHEH